MLLYKSNTEEDKEESEKFDFRQREWGCEEPILSFLTNLHTCILFISIPVFYLYVLVLYSCYLIFILLFLFHRVEARQEETRLVRPS